MSTTPNKVKFGLSTVYYAVATIDENNVATYGTPVRLPGAVSLSMEAQGENTAFRADNIDYWVANNNNGYEGDLELALIPDSFRTDVLGDQADSNGVILEVDHPDSVHFALIFQFEGDQSATRHILYNCTATRPTVSGQTTEESIEPQTETITIKAGKVFNSALSKFVTKARIPYSDTATDPYTTTLTTVYQTA